ncbi:hypothetical protein EDB85DRAFT_2141010 [Lactarius pseudohatsudake]|nr:hypothetical protein EDB85DRAFT_2141010 [Lactarius pseudohatsudake]
MEEEKMRPVAAKTTLPTTTPAIATSSNTVRAPAADAHKTSSTSPPMPLPPWSSNHATAISTPALPRQRPSRNRTVRPRKPQAMTSRQRNDVEATMARRQRRHQGYNGEAATTTLTLRRHRDIDGSHADTDDGGTV